MMIDINKATTARCMKPYCSLIENSCMFEKLTPYYIYD